VNSCTQESDAASDQARTSISPLPTLRVRSGHALSHLMRLESDSVHGVFLDPPFQDFSLLLALLTQAMRVLMPGGWVYVETGIAHERIPGWPTPAQGLHLHRSSQAGQVHFGLWQVTTSSQSS
jgi:16S rRNA (guanine966-N2)-methyltransferase